MGTPVIATDVDSGPRELLSPDTNINYKTENLEQAEYGILIPIDNNQSPRFNNLQLSNSEKYIMEAMSLLLDNKDIRESYINRSEYRVINFEINQIIPQWEEILENFLN